MIKLILFVTMSCAGCGIKREVDRNVAIEVAFAQTWKVDLKKDSFTMFYISRSPLAINLGLTQAEKTRITDAWYSLELDQLSPQTTIHDNCRGMPKLNTVIRARTAAHSQEITIDAHCDDFSLFDSKKAERVKKFIKIIQDIVFSRPTVKGAPNSDVFYM